MTERPTFPLPSSPPPPSGRRIVGVTGGILMALLGVSVAVVLVCAGLFYGLFRVMFHGVGDSVPPGESAMCAVLSKQDVQKILGGRVEYGEIRSTDDCVYRVTGAERGNNLLVYAERDSRVRSDKLAYVSAMKADVAAGQAVPVESLGEYAVASDENGRVEVVAGENRFQVSFGAADPVSSVPRMGPGIDLVRTAIAHADR